MSDLTNGERRKGVRVHFETEVTLRADDRELKVTGSSSDLSLKGMFLKTTETFVAGTPCQVEVLLVGGPLLEMEGRVVRQEAGGIGLLFDSVEVDSYVHLKNVVRYNAPDADSV